MIEAHDVFFVPEQFPTIQSAVDAAQHPTTIMAAPGYYDESVIVIDKQYVVIQSARLTRRGVTLTGQEGHSVFCRGAVDPLPERDRSSFGRANARNMG